MAAPRRKAAKKKVKARAKAKAKTKLKTRTASRTSRKPKTSAKRTKPAVGLNVGDGLEGLAVTQILDACPFGVAISNVDDAKLVYVNDAMAAMFEIPASQALGRHVASFYADPADREHVRATLVSKGEIQKFALRGRTVNGMIRSSRLSARIIVYRGRPSVLSWMEDETERTQREDAILTASRQVDLLRQIAGIANRAVNFFDALRKSTAEIARAIGWPAGLAYRLAHDDDSLLQLSYLSLPKDRPEFEGLRQVVMGRAFHAGEDLPGRALAQKSIGWIADVAADPGNTRFSRDDSVRIRSALFVPIVAGDRVVAVIEFLTDRTMPRDERTILTLEQLSLELGRVYLRDKTTVALQEARAEAESSTRAKASFLAAMSHEVRTPMNGVVGMVDLVLQTNLDDEQRFMLQTVKDSGHALITVINDILDFSKIEAGRLEIESAEFSVAKTLEDVALSLAPAAAQKDLSLITYADPAIPETVLGDAVRVRQILTNLGANAVKFSERGEILIKAERAADPGVGMVGVRFSVRDEGMGISAEVRGRLFQEFQQADTSTTRRFGGTGLGLAICHRLTTLMSGEIGVDSMLGVGSEFHCTLPFALADDAPDRGFAADLADLRVLVMTYSVELRTVLTAYLSQWRADVQSAATTRECLALARAAAKDGRPVDVVVVLRAGESRQVAALHQGFMDAGLERQPRFVFGRDVRDASEALRRLEDVAWLDVNPVRRGALAQAVAVAAGRASPEARISEAFAPVAAPVVPTIEAALADGRLILVAEDHVSNQEVLRRQLNRLGYACEIAADGVQALEMWRAKDYALLLTDCHMPDLDGFGLTAAIRADEKKTGAARKPIVAITANILQGEAERCVAAGMDGFLPKPVELATLGKTLIALIGGEPPSVPAPSSEETCGNVDAALPILDMTQVVKVYGGIDAEVRKVYATYLRSVEPLISQFQDELAHSRHTEARDTVHKARGATANAGGKELAALLRDVEVALVEERYDDAVDCARVVVPAWERLAQAIAQI